MIHGLHAPWLPLGNLVPILLNGKGVLVVPIWRGRGDPQDSNNYYYDIILFSEQGKVLTHPLLMQLCKFVANCWFCRERGRESSLGHILALYIHGRTSGIVGKNMEPPSLTNNPDNNRTTHNQWPSYNCSGITLCILSCPTISRSMSFIPISPLFLEGRKVQIMFHNTS